MRLRRAVACWILVIGSSMVALAQPAFAESFYPAPDPVSDITVVGGNTMATVLWSPPANTGDSPLDHYQVVALNPDGTNVSGVAAVTVTAASGLHYAELYGFATGIYFSVEVYAFNADGYSSAVLSAQSNTGVPYQSTTSFHPPTFTSGLAATQNVPLKSAVGRLFFQTSPNATSMSWCTAEVVSARVETTVITAGHCVNSGGTGPSTPGTWYSNFLFCPNWPSSLACYSPDNVAVSASWYDYGSAAPTGDTHEDFAALRIPNINGERLQSITGGFGAWFSGDELGFAKQQQQLTLLGYPANVDSGNALAYCSGTISTLQNIGNSDAEEGSQYNIGCDMQGGSSGGPWYTSDLYMHSITSFGLPGLPNQLFGPWFDAREFAVYATLQ